MTAPKSTTLTPRNRPQLAAIRLGRSERTAHEMRFGTLLTGFMRLLALLWIAQGLMNWSLVLGSGDDGRAPLEAMGDLEVTTVVAFAVLDLIAAVGLWLAASWGGVVWLVVVAGQWMAMLVMPGFQRFDLAIAVADVVLVALYFVLTWRAAQELDQ